ncbi:MAG: hypothetical protein EON54_04405 [Alcaligenaceae bacterium]|nr:MAG: hypothetical protein EON54_04405 [Alcaligenaceae bacterium]
MSKFKAVVVYGNVQSPQPLIPPHGVTILSDDVGAELTGIPIMVDWRNKPLTGLQQLIGQL